MYRNPTQHVTMRFRSVGNRFISRGGRDLLIFPSNDFIIRGKLMYLFNGIISHCLCKIVPLTIRCNRVDLHQPTPVRKWQIHSVVFPPPVHGKLNLWTLTDWLLEAAAAAPPPPTQTVNGNPHSNFTPNDSAKRRKWSLQWAAQWESERCRLN